MKRATHFWKRLFAIVAVALMLIPASVAMAAKPASPPGHGGGGETTLTNNLSVPTIFVPGTGTFNLTCPGGPTDPPGATDPIQEPLTGYPVAGYYYVQGTHTWQAECTTAAANSVTAAVDWGDNLEGTALKASTPIRVEVGLTDNSVNDMVGYHVIKLDPGASDKLSPYGTEAQSASGGANPTTFPITYTTTGESGTVTVTDYVRVYDLNAKFSLYNETTGTYVVAENTPMSDEINSTGKVVYGFNWGATGKGVKTLPTAGTYLLKFYAPNVSLTVSGPNSTVSEDGHTATLRFVVNAKNSGGGGGKPVR